MNTGQISCAPHLLLIRIVLLREPYIVNGPFINFGDFLIIITDLIYPTKIIALYCIGFNIVFHR